MSVFPSGLCRSLGICLLLQLVVSPLVAASTFIDRFEEDDLRVVSFNVYRDRIFPRELGYPEDTPARFARIVNAIQPDILNLQEIYRHSTEEVASLMNTVAPLPDGGEWFTHRVSDNVIVSRYPFLSTGGRFGWAEALVDLPDEIYSDDIFVMNDHYSCCNNESSRQSSASLMVRHLEDLRTPGGNVDLKKNTPILVLGDLNIVRSGQPLQTLLTGDIVNEDRFGPDSPPDWDGTALANAIPLQNGRGPENYTWRNDNEIFDPGILDFILYTDSVLTTANEFVLNTTSMSEQELSESGLEANDVTIVAQTGFYDHLPVVADFRLTKIPEPGSCILVVIFAVVQILSRKNTKSVLTKPS